MKLVLFAVGVGAGGSGVAVGGIGVGVAGSAVGVGGTGVEVAVNGVAVAGVRVTGSATSWLLVQLVTMTATTSTAAASL